MARTQNDEPQVVEPVAASVFDHLLDVVVKSTVAETIAPLAKYEIVGIGPYNVLSRFYTNGTNGMNAADALVANRGYRTMLKNEGAKLLEDKDFIALPSDEARHAKMQRFALEYVPEMGRDTDPDRIGDIIDSHVKALCVAQKKLGMGDDTAAATARGKQAEILLKSDNPDVVSRHAGAIVERLRMVLNTRNEPSKRGRAKTATAETADDSLDF